MSDASLMPGVGEALRQAREARELSLLQVAQALHIKPHYLEALEREDWDALPSRAHARGFLRVYAAHLGLDLEALQPRRESPPPPPKASPDAEPHRPSEEAQDAPEAHEIFRRLGETLRTQRETLGFSLRDMEQLTRVKAHYLRALEEGRIDALPSPVQGRGMLLHYARALHLDPEPLLLDFAAGLQARLKSRQADRPKGWRGLWGLRARHWGNVFLAAGAVAAMVLFLLWSTLQVLAVYARRAETPTVAPLAVSVWTPVRPSPEGVTEPRPTPAVTLDLPPQDTALASPTVLAEEDATDLSPTPAESLTAPPPQPDTSPVHVVVLVRHRAWLRVVADEREVFRARVAPGETFTFRAEERLELYTGDAAAVHLVYNQTDLGVPGRVGEPLVLIFTPTNMQTPTPLASPTPTATPTRTPTPTGPTPTSGSPTATETPSATPTPALQPRP